MVPAQLSGGAAVSCGLSSRTSNWAIPSKGFLYFPAKRINFVNGGLCSLSPDREKRFLPYPVIRQRKHFSPTFNSQFSSDNDLQPNELQNPLIPPSNSSEGLNDDLNGPVSSHTKEELREYPNTTSQSNDARRELLLLSLPAIGGQAIEPMVQLMETAYIGHLGSVELASAGVSISLFNIVSKLFNIPLLSVATSFVAEDISKNASKFSSSEKMKLSSVSTALTLAVGIGIFEAMALSLGSGTLLSLMGISPVSSMRAPAQRFLLLRAIGAPAFVVSLALQGIFRGFKDTKTPVFCLGVGNFSAIFLFPLFMYYCRLGVYGAAISTVVSQYIVTISMIWHLNKRAVLLPPKLGELQFGGYLKSGGFLIGRTLAVLLTMTLGTSMAARQGPVAMAAHQICLQVWLAVSLLTDALAASAQALIAGYASKDDYRTVKDITQFVLKIGCVTGVSLAVILGVSFGSLAPLFTKDVEVLGVVRNGLLFVSASQPINALAFIFDGLHYGVSDFRYAAISMMMVGAISSAFLLYAPKAFGLPGVWAGLTLFMGLRAVAGFIRILQPRGPWWFLHDNVLKPEIFFMSTMKKKRHVGDERIGVQILQGFIFLRRRRRRLHHLLPLLATVSGCLLLLLAILLFLSPPISNHINTSLSDRAHINVEEERDFRVPMNGGSSHRDLWASNQSNFFHGCSSSSDDYLTAEMRTEPRRYLLIATSGGLNQQRTGIVDAVVSAYILNATLVVPKLDQESFWKDASNFSEIFDVDWFTRYLSKDVRIIIQLPEKAGKVITTRVPRKCNQKCYEARILPIYHKKRVQAVQLTKFDYRLSNRLAMDLQKLRCRVNYHALKFTDPILEMGMKLVERMRMKSKRYVSLHLRFESDMLAFSGCYYGGGDKEMKDLGTIRKRWKTLHTKNPDKERRHGKCPLSPEEVGLMLRALGFGNDVHIYVASGEVYGGEETLAPLKALFPNFHTKDTIASKDELARFSPYSSRMAALDFIVCDESDVFVANNNGNMAKILTGKRRYFGHKTTIRPNSSKLYRIFHDRHNMTWEEFTSLVRKFQSGFMGEPNDVSAGRGEFHEHPLPCICENSDSRALGDSTHSQLRVAKDENKGSRHGGEGNEEGFFSEDEQDLSETEYEQDRKYYDFLMKSEKQPEVEEMISD